MRRSNPVFNKIQKMENYYTSDYTCATYKGIGLKVLVYLLVTLIGAALGIYMLFNNPSAMIGSLVVSGLLTFIFAILAICVGIFLKLSIIEWIFNYFVIFFIINIT